MLTPEKERAYALKIWEHIPERQRVAMALTVRDPLSAWEDCGHKEIDATMPTRLGSDHNLRARVRRASDGCIVVAAWCQLAGEPADYAHIFDYDRDLRLEPWAFWICEDEEPTFHEDCHPLGPRSTLADACAQADAQLASGSRYFLTSMSSSELRSIGGDDGSPE